MAPPTDASDSAVAPFASAESTSMPFELRDNRGGGGGVNLWTVLRDRGRRGEGLSKRTCEVGDDVVKTALIADANCRPHDVNVVVIRGFEEFLL
jgi:hypothetical protein